MYVKVLARTTHPRMSLIQIMDYYSGHPTLAGHELRAGKPFLLSEEEVAANEQEIRMLLREGLVGLATEDDVPYELPAPKTYDPMGPPPEKPVAPALPERVEVRALPAPEPVVDVPVALPAPVTPVQPVVPEPVMPAPVEPVVEPVVDPVEPVVEPEPPVFDVRPRHEDVPLEPVVEPQEDPVPPAEAPEDVQEPDAPEEPAPEEPEDPPSVRPPLHVVGEEPEGGIDFLRDVLPKHVPEMGRKKKGKR